MKKNIVVIAMISLLVYSRAAYAVFDIMALIESILEYKAEIEHKVEEVQKKIQDIENRFRQGFDLSSNCFSNPLSCNPQEFTNYLDNINIDPITGATKVFSEWGWGLGEQSNPLPSLVDSGMMTKQDELMQNMLTTYTYNRGQGNDLVNLSDKRKEINQVVSDELALLFAKGATLHNELQNESDADLYFSSFPNGNMDEIRNAQDNIAILTATRFARILELRSNMISTASTAETTLQNQENLGDE